MQLANKLTWQCNTVKAAAHLQNINTFLPGNK